MSHGAGQPQQKPPISTLAVVALLCSLSIILLPIGLILAIVSLVRINNSRGALGGKTLAIIALVLSAVLVPTCVGINAAIAVPNFIKFQCRAKQSEAKSNLKALYVTQEQYLVDHGSYAPDLAALQFQPMGEQLRYHYRIVAASKDELHAEARGKDDMTGDLWSIDRGGEPRSVQDKCSGRD